MLWRDACEADKNEQAYRHGNDGALWSVWRIEGILTSALVETVTNGDYKDRDVSTQECDQFDDWLPTDPIDAVTRLGDLANAY